MLIGCGDDGGGTSDATADGSTTTGVTTSTTSVGGTMTTSTVTTDTTTDTTTGTTTDTTTGTTTDTTTGTGTTDTGTSGSTGPLCPDGEIICEDGQAKTCDGMGGFSDVQDCADECAPGIGCVLCLPGTSQCNGDTSETCNDQGDGWDYEYCDGVQGVMCDDMTGQCVGDCSNANLGLSYIGCDYYPTVSPNLHETQPWNFNYAVVVANTTANDADITVTQGGMMITQTTVGPNTAGVITLPYVTQLIMSTLNETGPSRLVTDGAYRLRSNQPVSVYQYNPIEYNSGFQYSYTNDAGILFPTNTWGLEHRVVSRNHWVPTQAPSYDLPGFYAVTSNTDATQVTLTPSATGGLVSAGGGVMADGTGVVMLDESDVLLVITTRAGGGTQMPDASDLTGTLVQSDNPVQVIGGVKCTDIPWNVHYCDRIEESVPSVEVLAKEYLVTPPLIPTGGNQPKAQMVRITATEDDTTLTYDPAGQGPGNIAAAGDYVEIPTTLVDFLITADKKVAVSQYMLGQNYGGGSGDPAMTITVPSEQYRDNYLIHAPTNYETSYANVTAPDGAQVLLDGVAVVGFATIGMTGYSVARVSMSNAGDGNHTFMSDEKFGVTIYGYGQYTSYWYPGGLDLNLIPQ